MWWYSCLAGACCWCGGGGVVVCGGGTLPTITGIFNPALSATLRRVAPGGTLSVPPYLSLTLRKSCELHILLGNLIKSTKGLVGGGSVVLVVWLWNVVGVFWVGGSYLVLVVGGLVVGGGTCCGDGDCL